MKPTKPAHSPRVQRVTTQGGRHDLCLLLFELDRQRAVLQHGGEVTRAVRSSKLPEI